MPNELLRYKIARQKPAVLQTAFRLVGSNDAAEIYIPALGPEWIISPIRFRAYVRKMGTRDLSELILGQALNELEQRQLLIERVDADGNTLVSIPTPLDYRTEAEKSLQQDIDVGDVSRLSTLANTGLRIRFDDYNPADEYQYILLNYKELPVYPDEA